MNIPHEYKHRAKEAYKDEDGFWIVLSECWKCPEWYGSEKTIHEDNMKDCLKILKETKFTLS